MPAHLLSHKQTHFVLWRPAHGDPAPTLYLGIPHTGFREIPLQRSPIFPEIWEVAATDCGLQENQVYHYWFKVRSSSPYGEPDALVYCTDPIAYTVDRHLLAPAISPFAASQAPASVILYRQGLLLPYDALEQTWEGNAAPSQALPANHRMVIYELPTRWTSQSEEDGVNTTGDGTFQSVRSLLQPSTTAKTANLKLDAYLAQLGINALELLPPADSDDQQTWGYGTANFFAADFDLSSDLNRDLNGDLSGGLSGDLIGGLNRDLNGDLSSETDRSLSPSGSATSALGELLQTCRRQGIRFFLDMVMAFARSNPYHHVNFADFYVHWKPAGEGDRDPEQGDRDGFGGDLFKFNYWVEGYHPITGEHSRFVPAREYLKLHLIHWILHYQVNGLRLDSVNNIGNYDFIQEFKDLARQLWMEQGGEGDRFLVVGEELSVPMVLLHEQRLDGLWNEHFKQIARQVILGKSIDGESFETTVRKLIDCRLLGFRDGTQSVNYLTSHDVGGFGNERLYNYLIQNGVSHTEERIKLAMVCLFTAVGIPMILAGEEFADEHDLNLQANCHNKQIDPVNFDRLHHPWRHRIFEYVARLIHFRIQSPALALNDTVFIHVDFEAGKRVLVWRRGYGEAIVVVVANFSDYGTPNPLSPEAEYLIPHFPATPFQKKWREITRDRVVPQEWVGREPIFPWEAKVYELE